MPKWDFCRGRRENVARRSVTDKMIDGMPVGF